MRRMSANELYCCDLCHRSVDADTRDRARRVWQPLIICEPCIREAGTHPVGLERSSLAATAVS